MKKPGKGYISKIIKAQQDTSDELLFLKLITKDNIGNRGHMENKDSRDTAL